VATQVGTYTWSATYNGDDNNNTAIDNGANESLTTIKASPSISTQASETANGVVGSALLSDSATVSGGYLPGGTVTFTLTAPDGSTVSETDAIANGLAATSGTYTATQVGTYKWHATYNGNTLNNTAIDNGANESLVTIKASPSISTTAGPNGTIYVGVTAPTLSDSATITGGYLPVAGSVTFTLRDPDGFVVYTHTDSNFADGITSGNFTGATLLGTYTWSASYSGNGLNNGAVDQSGAAEQVTIRDQVVNGEAATLGFWSNKNGQKLLQSYSASIGTWLATTYGNLFGNLSGATGTQVANYFLNQVKPNTGGLTNNLYAQALTTALGEYVTGLGFNATAHSYGFVQGFGGTGLAGIYFNVGNNGASFGVANGSNMTVGDELAYLNSHTVRTGGTITAKPTSIAFYGGDTNLQNGADNVFNGINNTGDIV
jgi:hypothetical protein